MTTSECERCFSTLKRIKNFLRNTMDQDRLTALAMLSIEQKLVKNINNFNENVIEIFSSTKEEESRFLCTSKILVRFLNPYFIVFICAHCQISPQAATA
jgi:hypothetical protein